MATFSTVLIIPAALRDDANLLGAALGYGPESYTVEIPSDGEPTHWGSHSWPDAPFFATLLLAKTGAIPASVLVNGVEVAIDWEGRYGLNADALAAIAANLAAMVWESHGLTAGRVLAVLAALVISAPGSPIDPDGTPYASPSEHAAAVTAGLA